MTTTPPMIININLPIIDKALVEAARRRIVRARTQLLLRREFVFYATCALHLRIEDIPYLRTLGVDGTTLFYDPILIAGDLRLRRQINKEIAKVYIAAGKKPHKVYGENNDPEWNDEELIGVIAHEVSHCVKGDTWRQGSRKHRLFNLACDARINPEVEHAGLKLPGPVDPNDAKEVAFHNRLHDAANIGRSAEAIYNEWDQEGDGEIEGGGGGVGDGIGDNTIIIINDQSPSGNYGNTGCVMPNQPQLGQSQAQANRDQEQKWNVVGKQAAAIAQAQGHLPAGMEFLIKPIKPKLDPYAMLRHFVTMCRSEDYNWSRINRRYLWQGVVAPSQRSDGIGELVVSADMSGSTTHMWPKFVGFLNSVLEEVKPSKVTFIEWDAAVQNVTVFEEGQYLPQDKVAVKGGGGTSCRPSWEYIDKEQIRPVCAIVLTDFEMSRRDLGKDPGFPVLWVSTTPNQKAPFGELVEMLDE